MTRAEMLFWGGQQLASRAHQRVERRARICACLVDLRLEV
jgi:hypothetical protein